MRTITITYRERTMLDRYRCIDETRQVKTGDWWEYANILYIRTGRFSLKTISRDDIISIKED